MGLRLRAQANLRSVVGIFVPGKKGHAFCFLGNADNPDVDVDEDVFSNTTALSFACVGRLLSDKRPVASSKVLGWFWDGTIRVIDTTPDERQELSPKQSLALTNELSKNSEVATSELSNRIGPAPGLGFTLVNGDNGYVWHRPGFVVFSHGTKKNKKTFIVGQDENTYFGCELQDHPETVKDALLSLMPPEARGKKNVLRQGEWFAVPSKAPLKEDCIQALYGYFTLPMEPGGNPHCYADGSFRICADGVFVQGGELRHDNHDLLVLPKSGWFKFVILLPAIIRHLYGSYCPLHKLCILYLPGKDN